MKFFKPILLINLVFLCAVLAFGTQVQALTITPATLPQWTWTGNGNPDVYDFDPTLPDGIVTLYKMNVGGQEEGAFAPYYSTTFANSPTDPEDAEITWDGSEYISEQAYLIVKNGNSPDFAVHAYLFNLTGLGWDGMETINLEDFWVGNGAISHVEIAGGGAAPVPEPATMLLLGTGLVGLAGLGRKKFKK